MLVTSLTDIPVGSKTEELLDVEKYIHALSSFIKDAATPLTVGIQGEWGSGKTSMMNMIREDMEEANIATAWVNTWEYSMFRGPEEIAPSCMKGLLEHLKQECEERGTWPESLTDKVNKVGSFLKNVGKFAVNYGAKQITGEANVADTLTEGMGGNTKELRADVAQIKQQIQDIVATLIDDQSNPYRMVVFFVDDLDRIDPTVAVNVLEALKNLFDIPNAVFILAIDYEVVVKGLEVKFGKKTEQNDREFRSFFDKIIQVPFSMPMGSYNIERMISARLGSLGMALPEAEQSNYSSIVANTVGSNPRSIKRYINTFSLLSRLNDVDEDKKVDNVSKFVLFGMVGLQLAYPRIYQLILRDSNFLSWDEQFAEANQINLDDFPEELKSDDLYDELWEQIIWSYCQRDIYLKARSSSILQALNLIRRTATDSELPNVLDEVMSLTNITSVEDDISVKVEQGKRFHFDGFKAFQMAKLEQGFEKHSIEALGKLIKLATDALIDRGFEVKIKYAKTLVSINIDVPGRRTVIAYFGLKKKFADCCFYTGKENSVILPNGREELMNIRDVRFNTVEDMPNNWLQYVFDAAEFLKKDSVS